jgi:hypothetical protein
MLVFKSARIRSLGMPEYNLQDKVVLDFEVENVGKAIAHNPSLRYDLEVRPTSHFHKTYPKWIGHGTMKFMDDPPATPVVAEGEVEVPDKALGDFPDTLTLYYRLSYDDDATGASFDEKESCGQFFVERRLVPFPPMLQPCPPR